jgi:hypothetical protein
MRCDLSHRFWRYYGKLYIGTSIEVCQGMTKLWLGPMASIRGCCHCSTVRPSRLSETICIYSKCRQQLNADMHFAGLIESLYHLHSIGTRTEQALESYRVSCHLETLWQLPGSEIFFPLVFHSSAMDHPARAESNSWVDPASNAHSTLKEHHEVRPHTQCHTSSFAQCVPVNLPVTYRDLMHWAQTMQWSISGIEATTAQRTVAGEKTVAGETAHGAVMQALKAQVQSEKELLDAIIQSMCQMLNDKNVGEFCSRYNRNFIPFVFV